MSEHLWSAERREREPNTSPTFDLEQMEPDQVTELVAVLGDAEDQIIDAEIIRRRDPDPAFRKRAALYKMLERDIVNFPDRNPASAYNLYTALGTSEQDHPRAVAARGMGNLLRNMPEPSDARQQVVDLWVALCRDHGSEDSYAEIRGDALDGMSHAVHSDWLDEPTARYLNSTLPEGEDYDRDDWRDT